VSCCAHEWGKGGVGGGGGIILLGTTLIPLLSGLF